MIGTAAGALVIVLMAWLTSSLSHSEACIQNSAGHVTCHTAHVAVPVGPDGKPVTDQYYFVHQPLHGNGSITVRVTSLTGRYFAHSAVSAVPVGANPLADAVTAACSRGRRPA